MTTTGTITANGTTSSNSEVPACLQSTKPAGLSGLTDLNLPRSDEIMGRTICMQIKLSWTRDEMAERLARMRSILR